jgi:hypothetical protein
MVQTELDGPRHGLDGLPTIVIERGGSGLVVGLGDLGFI